MMCIVTAMIIVSEVGTVVAVETIQVVAWTAVILGTRQIMLKLIPDPRVSIAITAIAIIILYLIAIHRILLYA